jgi:aspartyl-tRNA(Asn)/glutamyl-tRNA(Gln) amidotransferase subunit B
MSINESYELVVGLEVHAQLLTRSKLFCGDSSVYGDEPNTNISPVTLAHPGTLPMMNKSAIGFAVKLGLACHCEIEKQNYFARKNYFYPDLPKGYQISQHTTPICKGGFVSITAKGKEKNIRLNRIHMEEDAGKSLHDVFETDTALDYNRAGTPLLEIVTEPDIRSGEEAYTYLSELRKIVRYLDICDGNMEEGSFRCDANVSVRKKGDTRLGTKVEVKNLNSIKNVKLAIEYEAERLVSLLENGEKVLQQTRSFDADTGITFAIRDKEDADDYRYFADPDLTPFHLADELVEEIRNQLPLLHFQKARHYVSTYQLSSYDAAVLTEEKEIADYFEELISSSTDKTNPKSAANWMMGPVKNWLNENKVTISSFPVRPGILSKLIRLVDENKLSFSAASTKVFMALLKNPGAVPLQLAEEMNLLMESNSGYILSVASDVLLQMGEKVKEYRKGKKGLLALFVGEVMKRSKGKADPKMVNEILLKLLNENQ